MAAAAEQVIDAAGWAARLALRFAPRGPVTRLVACRHHGPLTVQRPFQAGDGACHAYLLHPPGGVVGGDRLAIEIDAEAGAHVLATSPGATKFYRSAGAVARQQITLRVADGALLEWLPQETIAFAGARAESETRVELAAAAQHCGWEILCLGRPASGERFDPGQWCSRLAIDRGGQPLLRERLRVASPASLDGRAGLRGHPVVATLWATPATPALGAAVQARLAAHPAMTGGATLLDGLLVVRLLGDRAETVRTLLESAWRDFRAARGGRRPATPRIWAT